jgi:cytochrome c biogenesis protein CcmG/thiol:disulfide interchange protein DsbE
MDLHQSRDMVTHEGPGRGQQTWAGAARDVWRAAARHKLVSGLIALAAMASLIAIALVASGPSGSAPDPAAPAFSLPVLGQSAQKISLSDYAGKPLIVNFFASWCEPCQKETPLLARFYRAEHAQVAMVGLDENDTQANATSFTHKEAVSYPVGFDPGTVAASAYGVAGLPQTFFPTPGTASSTGCSARSRRPTSTAASRLRRDARTPTCATCWSSRPPR